MIFEGTTFFFHSCHGVRGNPEFCDVCGLPSMIGTLQPRIRLMGEIDGIVKAITDGVREKGRALTGDESLNLLLNLGLAESLNE